MDAVRADLCFQEASDKQLPYLERNRYYNNTDIGLMTYLRSMFAIRKTWMTTNTNKQVTARGTMTKIKSVRKEKRAFVIWTRMKTKRLD